MSAFKSNFGGDRTKKVQPVETGAGRTPLWTTYLTESEQASLRSNCFHERVNNGFKHFFNAGSGLTVFGSGAFYGSRIVPLEGITFGSGVIYLSITFLVAALWKGAGRMVERESLECKSAIEKLECTALSRVGSESRNGSQPRYRINVQP